jgi:hypothetical protein
LLQMANLLSLRTPINLASVAQAHLKFPISIYFPLSKVQQKRVKTILRPVTIEDC